MRLGSRHQRRAFTLVEILVVLAIIALLVTVVGVTLAGTMESTRRTRAQRDVNVLRDAVLQLARDTGRGPMQMSNPGSFQLSGGCQSGVKATGAELSGPNGGLLFQGGYPSCLGATTGCWRGPYLPEPVTQDPWGNDYVVDYCYAFRADGTPLAPGDGAVVVYSKGPDPAKPETFIRAYVTGSKGMILQGPPDAGVVPASNACNNAICNQPPSQCHEPVGACNVAFGLCSYPPKSNGIACDDSNACTVADVCDGTGQCVGQQKSCPPGQAPDCYGGTGQCIGGGCVYQALPSTASCNDQNPCTDPDTCNGGGVCVGTPKVCNTPPNSACYQPSGTCVGGTCQYTVNVNAACNDGNACTTNDRCNGGGTCAGTAISCTTPPNGACYQATGTCSGGNCTYTPLSWSQTCDDGNPCTDFDRCNGAGTCVGTPRVCNTAPAGQCWSSAGTCSAGTCVYPRAPAGTTCNDSNACTTSDVCAANGNCNGTPITCNSPPGQCYSANGSCSNGTCTYPAKGAGTPCDDGNSCTSSDVCNGAGTCSGTLLACNNAPNGCYNNPGSCSGGSCSYTPNNNSCNDGNNCSYNDRCSGGSCLGTGYSCPANSTCASYSCNGGGGCNASYNNGAVCGTNYNPCCYQQTLTNPCCSQTWNNCCTTTTTQTWNSCCYVESQPYTCCRTEYQYQCSTTLQFQCNWYTYCCGRDWWGSCNRWCSGLSCGYVWVTSCNWVPVTVCETCWQNVCVGCWQNVTTCNGCNQCNSCTYQSCVGCNQNSTCSGGACVP